MAQPPTPARRAALIGGGVAAALVVATGLWLSVHRHHRERPLPENPAVAAAPDLAPYYTGGQLGQPVSDAELESRNARPIERIVKTESGDTLQDVLMRAGVAAPDAQQAILALGDHFNPRLLKAGQEVTVSFLRPADHIGVGPFDGFSLRTDPGLSVVARRSGGGFSVSEVKRVLTRQVVRVSGTIKGSLFEAARAKGVPGSVLDDMIHAYSYDVDFQRGIHPGDRFDLLFERMIDKSGQVVHAGTILYANLVRAEGALPIYRHTDRSGNTDFYTSKGESVRKALLRTPVDGARITSGFGLRMHPILGFTTLHKGVDFAVRVGTPVMAAGNGVIMRAGRFGSYGIYVRIQHDPVHSTAYAHLSRLAAGIRPGKHVSQGQVIAYSGSTGRSTGPHLHYEVLVNNVQVNPMNVKFKSGIRLAGTELHHFQDTMRQDAVLLKQTAPAIETSNP